MDEWEPGLGSDDEPARPSGERWLLAACAAALAGLVLFKLGAAVPAHYDCGAGDAEAPGGTLIGIGVLLGLGVVVLGGWAAYRGPGLGVRIAGGAIAAAAMLLTPYGLLIWALREGGCAVS